MLKDEVNETKDLKSEDQKTKVKVTQVPIDCSCSNLQ